MKNIIAVEQNMCEVDDIKTIQDIKINEYSGNQKWQIYCLERFLNNNE